MNSVGKIPMSFIDNTPEYKAKIALGNAEQILAKYLVKAKSKEKTEIFFRPYSPLKNYQLILDLINKMIDIERFNEATDKSVELIDMCQEGLNYYQTYHVNYYSYDWFFLRTLVSFGYIGWIMFSTLFILKKYVYNAEKYPNKHPVWIDICAIIMVIGTVILMTLKRSPITYYLYAFFPIFFWSQTFKQVDVLRMAVRNNYMNFGYVLFTIIFYFIGLELLVHLS
jgi:phosphatidylinositol glycan class N